MFDHLGIKGYRPYLISLFCVNLLFQHLLLEFYDMILTMYAVVIAVMLGEMYINKY